ncbi:MAG: serine protease, partial [Actinomycetota bacterium]|nr:serine protease [Actinomycetota bacterium]
LLGMAWAGAASAQAGDARTSIVGGSTTTIKKWPWQIAFLQSTTRRPNAKPSERFICGGTLIAPTIVVTATHCAIEIDLSKPEYFSVVGGRTRLDKTSQGTEVPVKEAYFPLTRSGVPRYLFFFDTRWDVAVLELAEPIDQPTIKLAGPDETDLIRPGTVAYKTGWGMHEEGGEGEVSPVLRLAKTAIQPPRACDESIYDIFGFPFDRDSQVCIGDPASKASPCFGDSGGPAVVRSSDGYRLFGATSFGQGSRCNPKLVSVDAAIARPDTRDWVAGIAMERTGLDVVGGGATADSPPAYCVVPRLNGLKLAKAKAKLRRNRCGVGKLRRLVIQHGKRFRKLDDTVLRASESTFGFKERGHRVDMVVAKWTPKHRPGE